ncbi:hypothetical protein PMAYCL1PPCAC_19005, partial [Pristionchus mayeri]
VIVFIMRILLALLLLSIAILHLALAQRGFTGNFNGGGFNSGGGLNRQGFNMNAGGPRGSSGNFGFNRGKREANVPPIPAIPPIPSRGRRASGENAELEDTNTPVMMLWND